MEDLNNLTSYRPHITYCKLQYFQTHIYCMENVKQNMLNLDHGYTIVDRASRI